MGKHGKVAHWLRILQAVCTAAWIRKGRFLRRYFNRGRVSVEHFVKKTFASASPPAPRVSLCNSEVCESHPKCCSGRSFLDSHCRWHGGDRSSTSEVQQAGAGSCEARARWARTRPQSSSSRCSRNASRGPDGEADGSKDGLLECPRQPAVQ